VPEVRQNPRFELSHQFQDGVVTRGEEIRRVPVPPSNVQANVDVKQRQLAPSISGLKR
jgi:hypothetical protein